MYSKKIQVVVLLTLLWGCTKNENPHEVLLGTLWMQTSAEYQMITKQAYELAKIKLMDGLENSDWTAALEQTSNYAQLPPAIILDLDETVLNNSAYQARLAKENKSYDEDTWNQWVKEEKATLVPGALDFVKFALAQHVSVFYATNRTHDVEEATKNNLVKLGFPLNDQQDWILTKNEKENWGSDKTTRRNFLAQSHRIILLFGDDLNDFVSGAKVSLETRVELANKYKNYWGEKWITIPNPLYGSWEAALYEFDYSHSKEQKIQKKMNRLNTLK